MSNIVVITFDNAEEAGKVREAIRQQEKQGLISLDDSAVVVKDAEGKVHVRDQVDRGVKVGALGGSLLGLLIGGFLFPVAGLMIGALGGAGVGALTNLGIQKNFVKEVQDALKPNSSALFLIVRHADANAAMAALKPFKGEVYHTSLSTDAEETLRRVLSQRTSE